MPDDDDPEYDTYELANEFFDDYLNEYESIDDEDRDYLVDIIEDAFADILEFGHMADAGEMINSLLQFWDIEDIDIHQIMEALYEYVAG